MYGGDNLKLKRQYLLIAFIAYLVASLGAASAWIQAWNAPVGQPNTITSDGVDIFSASSTGLASVDPNGTTLWKAPNIVSSNGSAIKAGKYLFIGEGNDIKALNKTTGAVKWTSNASLGAKQVAKYILVKGAYIRVASNSKLVI